MALKPPGNASTIALLLSGFWTIMMLLSLIAGHLILAIVLFLHFDQALGMEVLVEKTGLSSLLLWILVAFSILLDGWIFLSGRKNNQDVRRR
ncbi:MAG: hypothetical protein Q9M11_00745 [Mariprofundaceae bacterium]|nr:hypothetical protein [Mariprofundaceae bacterium]